MTIAVALLLAAATAAQPTSAWLAGTWAVESESSRQDEGACTGDHAMRWGRGGRFAHGSLDGDTVAGEWRLSPGGHLSERAAFDAGEFARSRVERLGPDRMRLTDADGERLTLNRCR